MVLFELEFGSILDGDDAFVVAESARQCIEKCGFAGPSAAGNDDIEFRLDTNGEQISDLIAQRSLVHQLVHAEGTRKAPNRQLWPVDGQRREYDVDPLPGRETRVHHRTRLIDSTVDPGHDAIDGLQQLSFGSEPCTDTFDAAETLDIDLVGTVDHDFGDGGIGEERFENTQSKGIVDDLAYKFVACTRRHDRAFATDEQPHDSLEAGATLRSIEFGEFL